MIANPFVGLGRVAWMEVRSHLRSPRLIILAALFALAILGASYGLAQPQQRGFQNFPQLFGHPAVLNVSGVLHYRAIGWMADTFGAPVGGTAVSLYTVDRNGTATFQRPATTNASGFVSFDLGTSVRNDTAYEMRSDRGQTGVFFSPGLSKETFTIDVGQSSFSTPTSSRTIFFLHALALDGPPASQADVYLNDTLLGHPDGNGYFRLDIPNGDHTVRVSFRGQNQTFPVRGFESSGPVFSSGANAVLLFLSASLMPLLLPILAIAVSFDAIARERVQGSLEILLSRRVRREGILVGKFVGAFLSIAVPVVGVLLAGLGVVTLVSGRAPALPLSAAFVLASLFLISVYVLLMLIFSTLAKSVGTAVVFGVVVWLVFNVLFSFLAFFLLFSTGRDVSQRSFYETLSLIFLFDPNMVFQMLVSLALPSSGTSSLLTPSGYLGPAPIVAAAVIWAGVLLVVATVLFLRKSEA